MIAPNDEQAKTYWLAWKNLVYFLKPGMNVFLLVQIKINNLEESHTSSMGHS